MVCVWFYFGLRLVQFRFLKWRCRKSDLSSRTCRFRVY
nr:MAG TPA: hypothetical protein [Caudoviricetes sp.]